MSTLAHASQTPPLVEERWRIRTEADGAVTMRPHMRARAERLGLVLMLAVPWCVTTVFVILKTVPAALAEWPWTLLLVGMTAGSAALLAFCLWTACGVEEWQVGPGRLDRTRSLLGIRWRQHFHPTALVVRGYLSDEPQPRLWCLSIAEPERDRLAILESGTLEQMQELGQFLSRVCDLPLKAPTSGFQQFV
jgi:hypothetical protein